MHRLVSVAVVLGVLGVGGSALAVPVSTNFTARITDGNGPITGLVTLELKVFDAPTGGTEMWAETHNSVAATDGLVFVGMGSVDPVNNGLDATVFTGGDMYLEVIVDGDVQTPRLPIGSVPYAVHAATADSLGNLLPGDVSLANHHHDGTYAPASHNHSQYALNGHDHDSDYAPLSHTHGQYALATHNHDNDYAAKSHSHGAADIDAYADLEVAKKLNNDSGTDILLRGQGDSRYVDAAGDSMSGNLSLGANDVTADQFRFNGTRTGYFNVSAMALIGDSIVRHTGFGEAYLKSNVPQAWVEAPVNLPNGSTVTQLQCRFRDSDANGFIEIKLLRHSGYTGESEMAKITSATSSNYQTINDSTIGSAAVNNGAYAYYLMVFFKGVQNSSTLSFNRCRITYTYSEARH